MADNTLIEWADATLFPEGLPKRCSKCRQIKPAGEFARDRTRKADGREFVCWSCRYPSRVKGGPGAHERRAHAAVGERWCRLCQAWRPADNVTKQGLCREHQRAADRALYAENERHRQARRAHSIRHKRGVEPVPPEAQEMLLEEFEGLCAYCDKPSETWDHVVPVKKGGRTEPGNILPACNSCNSSKRDRDLDEWLKATSREMSIRAIERLSLFQVL